MTSPKFTAHWTSALTGTRKNISLKTKAEGLAECKALYKEGAKNIRLSEFKQGIGATDIDWRLSLRN
jgi:hypothetical protein